MAADFSPLYLVAVPTKLAQGRATNGRTRTKSSVDINFIWLRLDYWFGQIAAILVTLFDGGHLTSQGFGFRLIPEFCQRVNFTLFARFFHARTHRKSIPLRVSAEIPSFFQHGIHDI
jgi:hypothetical protein